MDDSMAITSRYIMPVMLPIDSTNSGMVTQQGAQSRIWQRCSETVKLDRF